ncbi:uncharacterized protein LOC103980872 isoform X1 [Musa acuminata AAA Group]|uniref:uncharacterized protein LOC103980872 isoform X1 n=1 Tax=Musa acuminata AAA Group TaxID=214697 RepID=UPI0031D24FB8
MDKSALVYLMFPLILTTIVFLNSCCGRHISGELFPSPTDFCCPLLRSDGTSASEAQAPQLKVISGLTNAAGDDHSGGYTGQTPSALQYFCCHKLRGINCCLSTEVGEVQSPQLMVASGIADTNISRPYLARSPGGDLKFAATSSHRKEDMSQMARLPRSTLEFASRSLVEGKADECADCRDGTIDNESDVKTPPADNHSKDSPSSGGEGSPPAASPEGASGPAAP